jgi:hypothetical protein
MGEPKGKIDYNDPEIAAVMEEHKEATTKVLPSGFVSDYQNKWAGPLTMTGIDFGMFDEKSIKPVLEPKSTYREWLSNDPQLDEKINLNNLSETQKENIAKVNQFAQKYNEEILSVTVDTFDEQKFKRLQEISRAAVEIITKANDQS